jgi:hypothetical protein
MNDGSEPLNPNSIEIARYKELLCRAVHEVLQPLRVTKDVLNMWRVSRASYVLPPGLLAQRLDLHLFAGLKHMQVDLI